MNARTVFFIAGIAAAAGIGFYAGRRSSVPSGEPQAARAEEAHDPAPAAIILAPELEQKLGIRAVRAETRRLRRMIEATGSVGPDEARMAHLRALARGRVDEVYVRLGDRVRKGQRLLTYDNVELGEVIGEYVAALAAVEKAESEAQVAKKAAERASNLVELGAIAQAEQQRRAAEYRSALANIEGSRAAAAKVEEKLHRFGLTDDDIGKLPRKDFDYHRQASHTTLVSPFDGTLTYLDAVPGETVDTNEVLMAVSDLSSVWVQADIYEKDIAAVHRGQAAEIAVEAYPDRVFPGRITYVSNALDPATRTAKVRAEVRNPENSLKLQMFAAVRIPAPSGRDAVVVPDAAVQQIDGQAAVFVKSGPGRYARRAVTLGRRSSGLVEISDGLRSGEAVVTEGSFVLKSELKKGELGHHEE